MKLALLFQSPEGTPHTAHSFTDTHTPLRCKSQFQPGNPCLLCSHLQPTVSTYQTDSHLQRIVSTYQTDCCHHETSRCQEQMKKWVDIKVGISGHMILLPAYYLHVVRESESLASCTFMLWSHSRVQKVWEGHSCHTGLDFLSVKHLPCFLSLVLENYIKVPTILLLPIRVINSFNKPLPPHNLCQSLWRSSLRPLNYHCHSYGMD